MRSGGLAVVLLLLATAGIQAQESESPGVTEAERPRLALALSGGGARGIAHIGVLRALEEAGIPVDAIAANSMGAVVGGIYAAGRTAQDLDDIVLSVDWGILFSGRPDRPIVPVARRQDRFRTFAGVDVGKGGPKLSAGLLGEHRVNRFLIEFLGPAGYGAEGDFDKLPIRFRCVATDLDTGDRVVLGQGDLARSVRASMSIPLAFPPVEVDGRTLVDGLLVDNLPVDVARQFGAPVVVAVDIGSPPLKPEDYKSALGIAEQITNLLTIRRNEDYAAEADVLIKPDLGRHSTTKYADFDTLIRKGYEATQAAIPQIRKRLEAAGVTSGPSTSLPSRPRPILEGTPIAEVVVRGHDRLSERVLRRTFNIPLGPGFMMEKGLRAFDKVEATGLLEHAWMQFEPAPGGLRVALVVREARPFRAEVGAAYTEWEKARGVLHFINRSTFGFGEEASLLLVASDAEAGGVLGLRGEMPFLKSFGYRLSGFVMSDKPRYFDEDGQTINRADFERKGFDAALQISLERWGLLEAGLRVGSTVTQRKAGIALPDATDDNRMVFATAIIDDMDSLLWPTRGRRLAVHAVWNSQDMGATRPFWRVEGEGRLGQRIGRRTVLQLDAFVGLSGKDLPEYDWFRMGGPYLIPGYAHEQLKGPQALAAAVSLRYQVLSELRVVVRGGAGNVFESRDAITADDLPWGVGVGLMYPSPVGPLALEMGWRDGGSSLVSLSLGWN